ncbi:hypothetical protein BpHYR1_050312, partial [Brachionus plicatilis]
MRFFSQICYLSQEIQRQFQKNSCELSKQLDKNMENFISRSPDLTIFNPAQIFSFIFKNFAICKIDSEKKIHLTDNNYSNGFDIVCVESCRFKIDCDQSNGYLPQIDTSNIVIRARKYRHLKHLTHLESFKKLIENYSFWI